MVEHAESKGLKKGDYKKLNLPFENKLMGLPAEVRERMVQDVEDFTYHMMAKVLKVRLNGTLLLDMNLERPDARPVTILLKPVTHELLQPGKNSLIIEFQTGGEGFITSLKTN